MESVLCTKVKSGNSEFCPSPRLHTLHFHSLGVIGTNSPVYPSAGPVWCLVLTCLGEGIAIEFPLVLVSMESDKVVLLLSSFSGTRTGTNTLVFLFNTQEYWRMKRYCLFHKHLSAHAVISIVVTFINKQGSWGYHILSGVLVFLLRWRCQQNFQQLTFQVEWFSL
jgi:hypothetical protein